MHVLVGVRVGASTGFCSSTVLATMLASRQVTGSLETSPRCARQRAGFILSPRSWRRGLLPSPRHASADGAALVVQAQGDSEERGVLLRELKTAPPEELEVELRSLGSRRRLIAGSLNVFAPPACVWSVLTAFNEMVDFVPHMLASDYDAETRQLEQVAWVSRRLKLQSRLVMDVQMQPERGELWFTKRESRDFVSWQGVYRIVPRGDTHSRLEYALDVVPMILFPMALVERKIMKEVPGVLRAFAARAEQRWKDKQSEAVETI
ncbi:hypothetical protein CCYA_CCYA09G2725 [Cyanidiococcus yangmingshanensis]|nr:hypothetical protein CCYA_CCYA09G2725 [Cyanidiococcus yangmingshanensis]